MCVIAGVPTRAGKETAKVLLQHNAKVYIACRSLDKAKAAATELQRITGKSDENLVVLKLDLSNLASVKAAVEEYLRFVFVTSLTIQVPN